MQGKMGLELPRNKSLLSVVLELRQAFDLFDSDRSGGISIIELKQALSALGVSINDQEARQMFSAIDADSKSKTWFAVEKTFHNLVYF